MIRGVNLSFSLVQTFHKLGGNYQRLLGDCVLSSKSSCPSIKQSVNLRHMVRLVHKKVFPLMATPLPQRVGTGSRTAATFT